MKHLTTQQLQTIERFLMEHYNLHHEDFRMEILDHIACEIEVCIQEGVSYQEASKFVLGKWHFELKPVLGKTGVPTCVVKQMYAKDWMVYLGFALLFLISWSLGNFGIVTIEPNPWLSLGCVLLGFVFSILIQKRFHKQKNYAMTFYTNALGNTMLPNIVVLTLAMLFIRRDFEQFFSLSSYSFFVLAIHILIVNVFFASKVLYYNKASKIQMI